MSFFSKPATAKLYDPRIETSARFRSYNNGGKTGKQSYAQDPIKGSQQKPEKPINFSGKKNSSTNGTGTDDVQEINGLVSSIIPKCNSLGDLNHNLEALNELTNKSVSFGQLSNKTRERAQFMIGRRPAIESDRDRALAEQSRSINDRMAFRGVNTVNHTERPPEMDEGTQTATANAAAMSMPRITAMRNLTPGEDTFEDRNFMTMA